MAEYAVESSQSINKSSVNKLFPTDVSNSTEAEHGSRLTAPEDAMSKCVASRTHDSYCSLLQRSLVVHESTIADRSSESLTIENLPFLKSSPMWAHIEEMEILKKVPQQPHFHLFKQLGLELCEAMALGLMVFFANLAENIKNLNIQDENALFEEKMKGLCLLEKHALGNTAAHKEESYPTMGCN
uniref:Uncharacterized protein n=1 Tax=Arundo donax TaxID=35708 RepID=A0A0A9GLJ1_ARUDO